MQFKIPFKGSQNEGVERVKQMLRENRTKIEENAVDLQEEWKDNILTFAFTAQGKHIEGTLTVRDNEFDVYAKLPLALRLFEGTIERMIEAEVKKLVAS
ncbi:MAG: polyhydroxyalkanoic acid system family protein [Candidatus Paceibacterota bacterium]